MEDISRELEREIAQTKPKPFKQDLKTRILIIDDFGCMKSGEFLKKFLIGLSASTAVLFLTTVIFSFLYFNLAGRSGGIHEKLETAERKLKAVTKEKEVLMARLVIHGKELPVQEPVKEKKKSPALVSKPAEPVKEATAIAAAPVKPKSEKKSPVVKPAVSPAPAGDVVPEKKAPGPVLDSPEKEADSPKEISVEKFEVGLDNGTKDLLVRFDIRNVSKSPGDVSGRIFTLLKPDEKDSEQWLVVPTVQLKNGVPSEHRKGQYFSIAHFKPVKFRIKNQPEPERFKRASIYIFSNKGRLMLEKHIKITDNNE